MRIRSSVIICSLSIGLPLLAGIVVPSVLGPTPAYAQPADPVTTLARERFNEGVKAYDGGRYEEARSLFLQAYSLKRHPAVLLNLGQAELKSGHAVEGGNHLQQFLREDRAATPDQIDAAKNGIADARKRAAHVIVIADVDGAAVAIDGLAVGITPLFDPVFVEPGEHTVTATMQGRTATSKTNATRGSASPVTLSLQALGVVPTAQPQPPPLPPPPPPPTSTAGQPPPLATTPAPYPYPPATGYAPYSTATGPTPMPTAYRPEAPSEGREPFFKWFADKPLEWVFTGIGGLGLVGTIGFGVASGSAKSATDKVTQDITDEVNRNKSNPKADGYLSAGWYNPDTGAAQPCGNKDDPSTAHPHYRDACSTLRDNMKTYNTDVALAIVSAVLLAGGATADVVYYFVDTAPSNKPSAKSRGPVFAVTPVLSPTEQGLGILGRF